MVVCTCGKRECSSCSSLIFHSLASFHFGSRELKPQLEPSDMWNPCARDARRRTKASRIHNRTTAWPCCEVASHRNQPENFTTNSLVYQRAFSNSLDNHRFHPLPVPGLHVEGVTPLELKALWYNRCTDLRCLDAAPVGAHGLNSSQHRYISVR
jgi:hypothetical protein